MEGVRWSSDEAIFPQDPGGDHGDGLPVAEGAGRDRRRHADRSVDHARPPARPRLTAPRPPRPRLRRRPRERHSEPAPRGLERPARAPAAAGGRGAARRPRGRADRAVQEGGRVGPRAGHDRHAEPGPGRRRARTSWPRSSSATSSARAPARRSARSARATRLRRRRRSSRRMRRRPRRPPRPARPSRRDHRHRHTGGRVTPAAGPAAARAAAPAADGTGGGGTKTTEFTYVLDVTFWANGHRRQIKGMEKLDVLPSPAQPAADLHGRHRRAPATRSSWSTRRSRPPARASASPAAATAPSSTWARGRSRSSRTRTATPTGCGSTRSARSRSATSPATRARPRQEEQVRARGGRRTGRRRRFVLPALTDLVVESERQSTQPATEERR